MDRVLLSFGLAFVLPFTIAPAQEDGGSPDSLSFDRSVPFVGDVAPECSFEGMERSESVALTRLCEAGPVVLEFGSYSTLATWDRAGREALVAPNAARGVQFVLVFCEEENPGRWAGGRDFSDIPASSSLERRRELAGRFKKECPTAFRVLLDPTSGSVFARFGSHWGAAFVLGRDGAVLYKERWASGEGIRQALDLVFEAKLHEAMTPVAHHEDEPEHEDRDRADAVEARLWPNDWQEGKPGPRDKEGWKKWGEEVERKFKERAAKVEERMGQVADPQKRAQGMEQLTQARRLLEESKSGHGPEALEKGAQAIQKLEWLGNALAKLGGEDARGDGQREDSDRHGHDGEKKDGERGEGERGNDGGGER